MKSDPPPQLTDQLQMPHSSHQSRQHMSAAFEDVHLNVALTLFPLSVSDPTNKTGTLVSNKARTQTDTQLLVSPGFSQLSALAGLLLLHTDGDVLMNEGGGLCGNPRVGTSLGLLLL